MLENMHLLIYRPILQWSTSVRVALRWIHINLPFIYSGSAASAVDSGKCPLAILQPYFTVLQLSQSGSAVDGEKSALVHSPLYFNVILLS